VSRSLLLVAQYAPPSPLIAARRIGGLAKYLAREGIRVTVLTSAMSGTGPIEGAAKVVRTGDLLTSRLNWRRGSLDALRGGVPASYSRRSRLEDVAVPDLGAVTWLPYALPAALRLARRERFDCVLTSSPPQSAHLVGRALRRRRIPWIAELRDGWMFEPPRPPFPAPQRALDARLERSTLTRADLVLGVTEPIVADARRRLRVRAELVTNAFDPEEHVDPTAADGLLRDGRTTLVHTGRMAVSGSTPKPLLDALASLGDLSDRLDVVLAGPLSEDERELVARAEQGGVVRWVGALERDRTLALQRTADALLVVTEGSTRKSVATGKLFEYLAARRPILVLGEETEAARIVRETGAGTATSATDPEAIAQAVRALVEDPPQPPGADAIAPYGFPAVAARLAELVEEVASTSERSQTSTL
jgi:glycosyltransferase involved in cell wall biosynthesis